MLAALLLAGLLGAAGAEEPPRLTAPPIAQEPIDLNHPPRDYAARAVRGWQVFVERQLLDEDPGMAEKALARLDRKLGQAEQLLPAGALKDLRGLKWFLLYGPKAKGGGRSNGFEYFQRIAPDHFPWLDPRMGGGMVIYSAENFVSLSEFWALKGLLHEFGHAQHLEHWPENRADIYDAWKHAMDAGLFQTVRSEDRDTFLPNYAAQNHLEYFAELTVMVFDRVDYYPYDRAGLRQYDPQGCSLVETLWGLGDPQPSKPASP